jgi:hypothetical protein
MLLLLTSLMGCANRYYEEDFCRTGQGVMGMSLWNQGGGGPKKFGDHCSKSFPDELL